jgi:hypothetical protein
MLLTDVQKRKTCNICESKMVEPKFRPAPCSEFVARCNVRVQVTGQLDCRILKSFKGQLSCRVFCNRDVFTSVFIDGTETGTS